MNGPRFKTRLSLLTAERIATVLIWLCVGFLGIVILHYGRRVLVCDRFVIRGDSMTPTLTSGEKVWVRKYLMGPRIYTHFDFSEEEPLRCIRLPGLRRLRAGDIAVFNSPDGWGHLDTLAFQLNYVYAKRCLGAAGDTIGARNSHYYSSGADPTGIPSEREDLLRSCPDSLLRSVGGFEMGHFAGEYDNWTIKDFGPLVVPSRGMSVRMDSIAVSHYAKVICYETGSRPEWRDGLAMLGDEPVPAYTFQKNWCFFVGDNVVDSRDCRYLGFVPEEFVVGIVVKHG